MDMNPADSQKRRGGSTALSAGRFHCTARFGAFSDFSASISAPMSAALRDAMRRHPAGSEWKGSQ